MSSKWFSLAYPVGGEQERPSGTDVTQLRAQVKRLQEQIPEYQCQADKLQKMELEIDALRVEIAELKVKGESGRTCDQGLNF